MWAQLTTVFVLAFSCFMSGHYIATLKGEKNLADYKLSQADAQAKVRHDWEAKLSAAESALADLRKSESLARADNDKLRQRIAGLQRGAKTAEAQWSLRLADMASRQEELGNRAETALRFCSKILH